MKVVCGLFFDGYISNIKGKKSYYMYLQMKKNHNLKGSTTIVKAWFHGENMKNKVVEAWYQGDTICYQEGIMVHSG